jgi:hypothetical protein
MNTTDAAFHILVAFRGLLPLLTPLALARIVAAEGANRRNRVSCVVAIARVSGLPAIAAGAGTFIIAIAAAGALGTGPIDGIAKAKTADALVLVSPIVVGQRIAAEATRLRLLYGLRRCGNHLSV